MGETESSANDEIRPMFALRVVAGPLELRRVSDEDNPALVSSVGTEKQQEVCGDT